MRNVVKRDAASGLDDYSPAKVVSMGNVIEVTTSMKKSFGPPCKKLNADFYMDTRTGEVHEIEHHDTRADDTSSIRRTLAHIRALVNTNVTDADKARWVTLTYAENMTDVKRLYEDYRRFWQKFCYWCKTNGHEKPEYITVQEPQGRGAWHVHAFFLWPTKAPYIPNNDVLAKLWGHGFTSCKALHDVDNIGAYFSAYLADMPLDEIEKLPVEVRHYLLSGREVVSKEFENDQELIKEKKFVKGARMVLYPAGMQIVRKTKGIKMPLVEHMTNAEAIEKASSAKLTFSCAYDVLGVNGELVNSFRKNYYNTKRK